MMETDSKKIAGSRHITLRLGDGMCQSRPEVTGKATKVILRIGQNRTAEGKQVLVSQLVNQAMAKICNIECLKKSMDLKSRVKWLGQNKLKAAFKGFNNDDCYRIEKKRLEFKTLLEMTKKKRKSEVNRNSSPVEAATDGKDLLRGQPKLLKSKGTYRCRSPRSLNAKTEKSKGGIDQEIKEDDDNNDSLEFEGSYYPGEKIKQLMLEKRVDEVVALHNSKFPMEVESKNALGHHHHEDHATCEDQPALALTKNRNMQSALTKARVSAPGYNYNQSSTGAIFQPNVDNNRVIVITRVFSQANQTVKDNRMSSLVRGVAVRKVYINGVNGYPPAAAASSNVKLPMVMSSKQTSDDDDTRKHLNYLRFIPFPNGLTHEKSILINVREGTIEYFLETGEWKWLDGTQENPIVLD